MSSLHIQDGSNNLYRRMKNHTLPTKPQDYILRIFMLSCFIFFLKNFAYCMSFSKIRWKCSRSYLNIREALYFFSLFLEKGKIGRALFIRKLSCSQSVWVPKTPLPKYFKMYLPYLLNMTVIYFLWKTLTKHSIFFHTLPFDVYISTSSWN